MLRATETGHTKTKNLSFMSDAFLADGLASLVQAPDA